MSRERAEESADAAAREWRATIIRAQKRRRFARAASYHANAFEPRQCQCRVIHIGVHGRQVDELATEVLSRLIGFARGRSETRALIVLQRVAVGQLRDVPISATAVAEVPSEVVSPHLVRLAFLFKGSQVGLSCARLPCCAQPGPNLEALCRSAC